MLLQSRSLARLAASGRALASASGGDYYIDFGALAANDVPISQGGVWLNNTSSGMNTNTSMQIRLSADGSTRICCESDAPHINYEDSIGFVPGYPGSQRVVGTIYREAGYAPNVADANHEIELYAGAVVYGNDNKRCIQVAANADGDWFLALHNGGAASGWIVVYSAAVASGVPPLDGQVVTLEVDTAAKTIKCWHQTTLRLSTQWNTTHDEITSEWQAVLNNLGNGAGLAGIRRSGATAAVGKMGWRNFRISQTLLGGP